MWKTKCALTLWTLIIMVGCGPDTIFVRPGLDTPAQHVSNGRRFLQRGKLDDACREFNRARELDPDYVGAYVGLGVALGRKGDLDAGMEIMKQAERLSDSAQDRDAVEEGYRQLMEIKRRTESESPNE